MVRGSVRPSTFGIIDAFPDEAARERHLAGPVGKALAEKPDELFASPPDISNLDVIANKLGHRASTGSELSCLTARFPLCRCRSEVAATAPMRVAGLRSR